MSNYLKQYLAYIESWAEESDDNIQHLIDEFKLLMKVGDFSSNSAIDSEFHMLENLAKEVRDLKIASDSTQLGADVSAVAASFSFGLSMIAFVPTQTAAIATKVVASTKAKKLNEKLTTVGSDISAKINPQVHRYIEKFKSNNTVFKEMGSVVSGRLARKFLFTFMASVYHARKSLDVEWFRQYANVAKKLNDDLLNEVGDALDKMTLQDKRRSTLDAQIEDVMNKLKRLQSSNPVQHFLQVARFPVFIFMIKDLRVPAEKVLKFGAKILSKVMVGIVAEEAGIAKCVKAVEIFSRVIGVAFAIVDIVFSIYDIVHVVQQYNALVKKLDKEIKPRYKEFYDGIKKASKALNKAMKKLPASHDNLAL